MSYARSVSSSALCSILVLTAVGCGGEGGEVPAEEVGSVDEEIVNGFITGNPTNSALPKIVLPTGQICSAVLMKNLAVMTAKHCVLDYVNQPQSINVVQGIHSSVAQTIALHNTTDVAIVRLQTRLPSVVNGQVSFFNYFRGIYGGSDASLNNKDLMLFGYGWNTVNCTGAGTLRHAVVRAIDDAAPGIYTFANSQGQIGYSGDSGGPLLDGFSSSASRLVGILSMCNNAQCGVQPPLLCSYDTAASWGTWAALVLLSIPN